MSVRMIHRTSKIVGTASSLLAVFLCTSCSSIHAPGPHGTDGSPSAADRALVWLAGQQRSDGHWGTGEHRTTLTCLATLALLACDETPASDGALGRTMEKALRAVLHDAGMEINRPQEEK